MFGESRDFRLGQLLRAPTLPVSDGWLRHVSFVCLVLPASVSWVELSISQEPFALILVARLLVSRTCASSTAPVGIALDCTLHTAPDHRWTWLGCIPRVSLPQDIPECLSTSRLPTGASVDSKGEASFHPLGLCSADLQVLIAHFRGFLLTADVDDAYDLH